MVLLPFTECFSYDLASVCRKRYSPDIDFTLGKVSQTQLSTFLKETFSFSYQNDLDDTQGHVENRVSLYGSFYNVEGIPDGAYSYDNGTHALRRIYRGGLPGVFTIWINHAQCEFVSSSTLYACGWRQGSPQREYWGIEDTVFNRWKRAFSCNGCSWCRVH